MAEDSRASVGAILGGLAALIVAITGLWSVVRPNPKPSDKPSSVIGAANQQSQVSPSPTPLPTQAVPRHPPRLFGHTPLVNPVAPSYVAPTPDVRKVVAPFDINGDWSGVTGSSHGHLWLRLFNTTGERTLTGTLSFVYCNDKAYTHPLNSMSSWDGTKLNVYADVAASAYFPAKVVRVNAQKQGEALVGTYYDEGYQNLELRPGRGDACVDR